MSRNDQPSMIVKYISMQSLEIKKKKFEKTEQQLADMLYISYLSVCSTSFYFHLLYPI